MGIATLDTIKSWFKTDLIPTELQFHDTWDSFRHKSEKVPIQDINDIDNFLDNKVDKAEFEDHIINPDAHPDKEDKARKNQANGYAGLDSLAKISTGNLYMINDLLTGGENPLTAEQGKILGENAKVFREQIDAINTILTSNDVNLDTVQELVDAIKTVQTSLNTILVNDLTTGGITKALSAEMGKILQASKVDKVAGERLINASEISKLSTIGNVVTTVKSIASTVLTSQDVTGFVAYINALVINLVVGSNETVLYKTTDTGRVFEILLRGRSFGVGQIAITTADVIEVTEFLNKDIALRNYPQSRNDGQLPSNKVLSTDAFGNVKLYTIATAPAPYLEVLIPDSTLPSTTTNFILKGAFFTPSMSVAIAGQTINYITFVSDNQVKVNVTTGSAEGLFAVTLNNGLSATFNNALMIVLGTVYSPTTSDWISKTGAITIDNDKVETLSYGSPGSAVWNKELNWTKNFEVRFIPRKTPLGVPAGFLTTNFQLVNVSDGSNKLRLGFSYPSPYVQVIYSFDAEGAALGFDYASSSSLDAWNNNIEGKEIKIRWLNGVLTLWQNGILKKTLPSSFTQNMRIKASVGALDLSNIKYIELTT